MDCIFTSLLILTPYPALDERARFPSREASFAALQANRTYRRYAEAMQQIEQHRWWHWQDVLNENEQLYNIWDHLHGAQGGDGGDEAYWLMSLHRLREQLDPCDFALGIMPPPMPTWRFVRAR